MESFARMCRQSKEYQGDGWGFSYRHLGSWVTHRQLSPIWDSQIPNCGYSDALLVHARSGFEQYEKKIAFNMPFGDENTQFLFNGELRGVRLKAEGITGAQKIFSLLKRLNQGNWQDALVRTVHIIEKQAKYVKAANILFAFRDEFWGTTLFSEDPDYFTLWSHHGGGIQVVCSEPLDCLNEWYPIPNRTLFKLGDGSRSGASILLAKAPEWPNSRGKHPACQAQA